ncbi:SDR family oxidoreductase [Rhodococcus triatomae]|uniref:3-oxoacyl-[acyl-carrier protein] reductase n=1 Tax=Rhodococcus triatomae TaxID=300028 RepID=A0A1G8JFB3_9NOCA|nr:SDR family oxidoreductase [Rhodococcus triatomae]QNG19729.1 SDR family oxidoreductase [Rhodococcus triatomae]QNG24355.1 SDR family oxidoreductase [Rhodococcus triatomae]SDI29974.1 3-oxoacyl-[acyl-carrier protein] reductase [Rhodococcus triatomae]
MGTVPQSQPPLSGRVALVTGVGRRRGIGFAVARRLAGMGADLFLTHYRPHDELQPWGADDPAELRAALITEFPGTRVVDEGADLADPGAPRAVVDAAVAAFGHLDILVCNQARSGGDGALADLDAQMLDGHWHVDARATLLLTQEFARRHDGRKGGRVVWMTSGQNLGPLRGEVAYAAAKAALAGVLPTVADELVDSGIVLNAVNPGPVDTGYLSVDTADRSPEIVRAVRAAFPGGRPGEPDDPARLIAWLVSDEARWVVGQVIDSEGGFRRSRW